MEENRIVGRRGGLLGGLGVLAAAGLFVLNTFVLAGEEIHRGTLRPGSSLEWELDPARGEHTLKVHTRREQSVKVRIAGPDGEELYFHRELAARKGSRYFHFTPRRKGRHRITMGRGGIGLGLSSPHCSLSLYINDRRLFTWL